MCPFILSLPPPLLLYFARRSSSACGMGNSNSDRGGGGQGERSPSYRDGQQGGKDARPKILMDSTEDSDLFQREDVKANAEMQEFFEWQQDLENLTKGSTHARPTVFRWTGAAKDVYVSGSFNNWGSKIPLNKSQNSFVAIVDLPEGEHQYKFCVDGQWTLDPTGSVVTSKTGTVNNVIQVKTTDFEVFDALRIDSLDSADELSSSPPGPYHQDSYTIKPEDKLKHPPNLPPHLLQVLLNKDTGISCDPTLLPEPNHVMLNHLYALSIKDGVMVLSASHRYKRST
uniref:Protein kinase, AMP-activated, beta 1 non-catalytic subunit, b n=2 Tax=Neogobius melanostomus TaxID=47308 RepID=A0A8C6USB8_9GOBI